MVGMQGLSYLLQLMRKEGVKKSKISSTFLLMIHWCGCCVKNSVVKEKPLQCYLKYWACPSLIDMITSKQISVLFNSGMLMLTLYA